MRFVRVGFVLLFVAIYGSPSAANQPNKIERTTYSCWKYKFTSISNNQFQGECFWSDEKGGYQAGNLDGKFSNISYHENNDGTVDMEGKWSANNVSGTFQFKVAKDKESFDGTYKVDGSSVARPWSGEQTYGYSKYSFDQNGNRYYCKCFFRKPNGGYDHCWCMWYPDHSNRCYWCLRDFSYWGCCRKNGTWWKRNNSWVTWNNPKCTGCDFRCWCFPPPPSDNDDIPVSDTNIPAPPEPNAPILNS
ncbi:hypothetical protein LOC68_15920 [Blastopirellula sp. JC732]|uniref:Uncharacterized protein n=1 Tax=Blastopirellula sediminis TaxID=2894196 RepID=A0A9X1SGY4_9BACT|nr:hypothetical protein [Blastopirellula sediminis]MCC9606825.1 hypothetical protein [Blastopirellula sediminis]MCC9629878.1 hypothetical protein [Blastopirellula sediminis]